MMRPSTYLIIGLAVLAGFGCRQKSTGTRSSAPPFETGGTITNLNGTATGKVWGVTIEVADTRGAETTLQFDGTVSGDLKYTDAKQTIVVGEVTIVLSKESTNPIALSINETSYGTIRVGDALSIDEAGQISVNGQTRTPK
jgi:hypothetical protein